MSLQATPSLTELLARLAEPASYLHKVGAIEIHQTHISVVFLAGDFAYKIKKPVNLGFLDFSTLPKRRHFCEEEVRLNRRLAPHIYLDVVPITRTNGQLRVGGTGPAVEWAVQMKRLPADATLAHRLIHGDVKPDVFRMLAERVAQFHEQAESNAHIASFGRFDIVAQNVRENFKQTAAHVGVTVCKEVYERVRSLTEQHLAVQRERIETRAARGVPCDTHGDLHLDHVYYFPDETPPNDLVMIDCIEFTERFRYADPVADMAFLVMDLYFHGRRDMGRLFADAYFQASGDGDGCALLPFYCAYRAVVRAKVEGMELAENEIDASEREAAESRAQAHWLLALGELEVPARRPALLMIGGLPGTGKSTLAHNLAQSAGFELLRSDVIRKELADAEEETARQAPIGEGIYERAWTERTYSELLNRAEQALWQGKRVLVDANFREEAQREHFLQLAIGCGVPALFICCQAPRAVVRARLEARRGDVSDADWTVYQALARKWEPLSAFTMRSTENLETSGDVAETAKKAREMLQRQELSC